MHLLTLGHYLNNNIKHLLLQDLLHHLKLLLS